MREIPYSEGDRGRSRRYDRRDDDEMYDRIMDYIESRGRGRSSSSVCREREAHQAEDESEHQREAESSVQSFHSMKLLL